MGTHNTLPSSTRRLFLRNSLMAMAAVATAASVSVQALADTAAAAVALPKLTILTADEYRILSAVGDAVIPQGGPFATGALDIDLASRIDSYLDPDDSALMQGIRGALMFIEHKAPGLVGKSGQYSQLATQDRESILLTLRDGGGDGTAVFAALRGLCMFYFYTADQAWPNIGYEGPLVKRGKPVYQVGG